MGIQFNNNNYKIILIIIIVLILFYVLTPYGAAGLRPPNNIVEKFSLPNVRVQKIQKEQEENEFDIQKTQERGLGRHDRIRFEGKWN